MDGPGGPHRLKAGAGNGCKKQSVSDMGATSYRLNPLLLAPLLYENGQKFSASAL